MRWLKVLVIGMGIVIVIGLTVVIVEVARRAGEPSQTTAEDRMAPAPPVIGAPYTVPPPAPAAARPPAMPKNITIAIPAGAKAEDMTLERDRLIVRLLLADGHTAFLMIDLATGRKLGLVTLEEGQDRPAGK